MAYEKKDYTESDGVKKLREQMEASLTAKPGAYESKWQPQIDQTVESILNRKPFEFSLDGDALWNQYKDRYVNLGQQAMMDTMGQAAKLTGGYGNSYAQQAGQQAYQGYLQGLTDKIPELYQMAYDRWNQRGQDLYQQYGLLNTQNQNAYNQWLGQYNQWVADRDWAAGRYDTERGYDYGQYRDSVADDQWKAQFDEDIRRFDFENDLGEFAPVASGRGGGGGYYGGYYGGGSGGGSGGGGGGGSGGGGTVEINSTPMPTTYRQMLVDAANTRDDLISLGMSPQQANAGAQDLANAWYGSTDDKWRSQWATMK